MTDKEFTDLALSFPGTEENPHFDRKAYKVTGKRIFTTLHEKSNSVNMKLSHADQKSFSDLSDSVYPVPNKWGEQGWTTFELSDLSREVVLSALEAAYAQCV